MKNKDTELIDTLNDLIQIHFDRIEGYRQAESNIKVESGLVSILRKNALLSKICISQIARKVLESGGSVAENGTFSGVLHRFWMTFKHELRTTEHQAVLEECLYGDKAMVRAYDSVLNAPTTMLPSSTRHMLQEQRNNIKLATKNLCSLLEGYELANQNFEDRNVATRRMRRTH